MKFCLLVFWVQIGGVYVRFVYGFFGSRPAECMCILFVGFLGPDQRICFIVGFCFTTSSEMKVPAEVADRIELKSRERREMGEKI